MNKNVIVAIVAVIVIVVAGAAAAVVLTNDDNKGGSTGDGDARTVTDILGREVRITSSERIVSQSANPTALLCGLGLSSKIVGVSTDAGIYEENPDIIGLTQDDFPKAINDGLASGKIMGLGGMYNMSAETIASAKPDLAVLDIYGSNDSIRAALDSLKITYIMVGSDTIEKMYDSIEILGSALGKESAAEKMISETKSTIGKVSDWCKSIVENELDGKRYNVALMMTATYAIGAKYVGGQIIDDLYVNNVFGNVGDGRYGTVSKEAIATVNPEIMMYQTLGMGDNVTDAADYINSLSSDPILKSVSAVKDGSVYAVKDGAKNATSNVNQGVVRAYAIFAMFIYEDYLTFEISEVFDSNNYSGYVSQFWEMINS